MNLALSETYVPGMVTVVIPTFNRARFLRECIGSALAQDYPQFEVIVVDDGSTDDTSQVCRQYGDGIRYFWKPNAGAASAKNFGIQQMRGEWLKFLDSDDVLERNALSTFIEWAGRLRAKLLLSDYADVDTRGNLLRYGSTKRWLEGDEHLRALWTGRDIGSVFGPYFALSGLGFIHRTLLLTVGLFDDTLSAEEDWEWDLRAVFIHRIHGLHVPLPLYRYRRHPGQLSRSKEGDARRHEGIRTVLKHHLANAIEVPPSVREHYRQESRRLVRIYLPIVMLVTFLRRTPFYIKDSGARISTTVRTFRTTARTLRTTVRPLRTLALSWAWAIAPSFMDCIYWAVNPPVDV